jgi:hypothetical protein
MHIESYNLMGELFREFVPQKSTVLDVGGADINGSYKQIVVDMQCDYKTLDFEDADYIVNGYNWQNIPMFDVIISGQMLEHDPFFWKTLANMSKKAVKYIIIIVPSKGNYHAYPVDCYRFMPDCAGAFAKIMKMELVKSLWQKDGDWGDLGMVFKH